MDYVPRSPFSVSIIDVTVANTNCDRTQISGLVARAHNVAQAIIGGCGHTSGTKRGEKSKSLVLRLFGRLFFDRTSII